MILSKYAPPRLDDIELKNIKIATNKIINCYVAIQTKSLEWVGSSLVAKHVRHDYCDA